jgi:hypothetical protein
MDASKAEKEASADKIDPMRGLNDGHGSMRPMFNFHSSMLYKPAFPWCQGFK